MTIDVEVKGLKELQRKAEQMVSDLHGAPILDAMRDSVLIIDRGAKQNAPVDTGRLRASITPAITSSGEDVEGVVGTNVYYAPFQEFGTRRGLKGKRYMQRAFEDNLDKIKKRFERAVNEVVEK